jgi:hypothetical protein
MTQINLEIARSAAACQGNIYETCLDFWVRFPSEILLDQICSGSFVCE